ncbi:hypothetical protein EV175_006471 [Coemansia sp. RSA 1933]|nr:hypothetical protein EV175_006471 [Coemansia sp. RSA 1933]
MALVTHPMPMDSMIRCPELREKALFVYDDPIYRKTYPDQYAQVEDRVPQLVELDAAPRFDYFVNPVCYRILQQRIHQSIWQLDSTSQYSLEYWGNDIGEENVLLYNTGLRVPWTSASQFRTPTDCYKIALAFWSPFQKRMWKHFLDSDTGPCYLDATYRCDRDGFQIWTLFFEYHNITVPVSYLVSTSITVSLVRNWLEALTASPNLLPMYKTIFVNSTELVDELVHVLPSWHVCYAKYYIIEEFRSLVTRPGRSADVQWDAQVVNAVRNIDIDLYSAMKVAAKPGTALFGLVEYLLDRKEKWLPKADHDLGLFNHSGVAVSRWRYLLWMTMLPRPNNMRIDAVVHYLHRQLTRGVEAIVNDQDSGLRTVQYRSMDTMEQGSRLLKKSLADARILPLADNLVCVSDGRELSSKAIVDLKHKVCFCSQFAEHKVCEHLVFCSSDDVHQPELVRLMESIPYA